MPIIYTYPSATPTTSDLLIFSDVSATDPAKDTRKCTVGDLVTLVGALIPGPGGGTVTSVELLPGTTGLSIADTGENPIITSGTFTIGGTLVVANGGTGLSTYLDGDMLYYNSVVSTIELQTLSAMADGDVLTLSGGLPKWDTQSTTGLVTTFNVDATTLPGLTPIAATSGAIVLSGTLGVIGGGTGLAALTSGYFLKGNGTSAVTLAQYADLTTDVTGILPVANGGTGLAALTDKAILLGSGTGAVAMLGPATNGQVLIGSTGLAPVFNTLTAGTNVTILNSAGAVTISSSAGAPIKVNYDNQLTLKGGTSGTYIPNVLRKAQYWNSGDFVYMEFYMEWNTLAHGCVGTVIMENLPLTAISPTGANNEQGSCVITVNDGWGASTSLSAPTTGRTGVTGGDEIIFRSMNFATNFGQFEDCLWTHFDAEVGLWKLAGTITWTLTSV